MAAKILRSLAVSAFCEDLAMMLGSGGILADEALTLIQGDSREGPLYEAAGAVLEGIRSGAPLAEAIAQSRYFPAYAARLIAVGETAGRTEDVLKSLAAYYETQDKLERKLRSAVVYPALLLLLMALVLAVLVGRVLPVFTGVYSSLAGNIAASSYSYIAAASGIGWVSLCVVAVLAALLLACLAVSCTPRGGETLRALLERLPFTAAASRRMAEAHFVTALATFTASAVDMDLAMEGAAEMVTHRGLRAQLEECRRQMAEGSSLAQAIYDNHVFEPLYARMLLIGARAGSPDPVLARLSDVFTEDANAKMDAIINSVEPALAGFLTISVGATLLAVMLPLIGILTAIG